MPERESLDAAALVKQVRDLCAGYGRRAATPAEARQLLKLPAAAAKAAA